MTALATRLLWKYIGCNVAESHEFERFIVDK